LQAAFRHSQIFHIVGNVVFFEDAIEDREVATGTLQI